MGETLQQHDASEAESQRRGQDDEADLAELPFANILIEVTRHGSRASYRPAGGETVDQKLHEIPAIYDRTVDELRDRLNARINERPGITRFNHNVGSLRMRATVLAAENDEKWVVLRRVPPEVPRLEALRLGRHATNEIRRFLTKPGLTVICGTFATGKTWTGCAALQDYCVRYGGVGISIESPTEFAMHQAMGPYGRCIQIPVDESAASAWETVAADVRKASPSIIYIGEVSTPAIAKVVIGLSTSGRPVLTTCHGSGIADGLRTLTSLAEDGGLTSARTTLAGTLVGMTHQTMASGRPRIRVMALDQERGAEMRQAIADGDDEAIDEEAGRQEAVAMASDDGADDLLGDGR